VDVFKAAKVVSSLLAVVVVNWSAARPGTSHAVVVTMLVGVLGVKIVQ